MSHEGAVAIVGMACRFPGAGSTGRFWANVRAGADTIARFTLEQLTAAGVAPELLAHPDYVPARGVLARGDRFDWPFFGYSLGEAAGIDPQQRVLLECAQTALDDAAIDPRRFPGLVGVFAGCDAGRAYEPSGDIDPTGVIGRDKDFLATRVAYKLGLRGPAMTVQTACSTSLVAVHVAAQNLLNYECDAALAGGVSLVLPQTIGYLYRQGHILSRDGRCRPFDAAASGTVPSSGVGLVVLRRLGDALADGSRIVAVIRGSAVNNDGGEKVGYTAPSVPGQRDAIRMAHARADVDPADIGYVEAHGTATPVGDPVELAALVAAFGGGTPRSEPCWLGAVKGNIGHTGAAAGVAGLIKTASMLTARELVPTVHFRQSNPDLRLAETPFRIVVERRPWLSAGPLLAGVSSFGIGGTNAHAVLESAPTGSPRPAVAAGPRVLCVSAASPTASAALRDQIADRLAAEPGPRLDDVERTLATGRRQFRYRTARVVDAAEGAATALRSAVEPTAATDHPRVAFLFPGQGTLRRGVGAAAYAALPAFRRAFDDARACAPVDLGVVLDPDADPSRLLDVEHQQLGLFALGYALAAQVRAWGVEPVAMLGHSIGEYVAATVAGLWQLPDALALVSARGRAMREAPPGRMLAVRDTGDLDAVAGNPALTLAVDAPGQRILSGPPEAIAELATALDAAGVAWRTLDVAAGFHSPLMRPVVAPLREALAATPSHPPRLPFVSNLTGGWADPVRVRDPDYWIDHLCAPVRLTAGIDTLLRAGAAMAVELGPGESMVRMLRRADASEGGHRSNELRAAVPMLGREPGREWRTVLEALAALWERGVDIRWDTVLADSGGRSCALPPHPLEPWRCDRPAAASERPDVDVGLSTYDTPSRHAADRPTSPPAVTRSAGPRPAASRRGVSRSVDLAAGLSWPARGSAALSGRPDLRTHLETYAAGLVGDVVLRRLSGGAAAGYGSAVGVDEIRVRLDPDGRHPRLVGAMLAAMAAQGWLAPVAGRLAIVPDAADRVAAVLGQRSRLDEVAGLAGLLEHCVGGYPAVLAGRTEPVSVVFPDGDAALLRAGYAGNAVAVDDAEPCLDALAATVRALWAARGGGTLRVLEIGAGHGDFAARLLDGWADDGGLTYHVTDVSAALVRRARERLSTLDADLRYTVFDITRDPAVQGFPPGSYDVVLGHNVVHVAPDVRTALRHLATLLAPGGWLGLIEVTRVDLWSQLIWGLAPGWWNFADDLRRDSPHLDAPTWTKLLEELGFDAIRAGPPDPEADHALLLAAAPADDGHPGGTAGATAEDVGAALAEIWRDLLGVSGIDDADDFFALGGDSLLTVNLVARVRDRLGVHIGLSAFSATPTFGRLVELTRDALTPAGTMSAAGTGSPLFLVAGAGGSSLPYRALTRLLGDEHPVHGLDAPGLHDGGRPLERFEDIAAHHVAALDEVAGRRYVLGGWSVGAMVAHEMARQLAARGAEVPLLVCIDGYVPHTGGRPLGRSPRQFLRGLRYHATAGRQLRPIAADLAEFRRVYHASIRAMLRYAPRPAPCSAVVFHTGLDARGRERVRRRVAPMYERGAEVHAVPGDHWSVLDEPHVAALATRVREVLARVGR